MSEKSDLLEQQAIDSHFNAAMRNAELAGKSALKPTGLCHNCEEEVEGERVFCDADCREDFDKRKFANSQRLY